MTRAISRQFHIPEPVLAVIRALEQAGFSAYVVGGSVRDLCLGRGPEDWDVATNARPEEIQKIFPESFYANKFFTVTVQTGAEDPRLAEIEVTTFRAEGKYEDFRHPEDVKPAKTIEEDLSRRDFTVNAIALGVDAHGAVVLVDPFGGEADLQTGVIRAVGDADARIGEDALRMLRAARFAAALGFSLESKTREAIKRHAGLLRAISKERIRDEFSKLIAIEDPESWNPGPEYGMKTDVPGKPAAHPAEEVRRIGASRAWQGIELLRELELLKEFLPELEEGVGCTQNKHHVYTVWEHNLRALDYAARQKWTPLVRIAALFHDIAKPRAKRGEGPDSTFYGHDVSGAKMSTEILGRLRYPDAFIETVAKLVRWHLFRYDYDADEVQTTDSAIRRLIRNIGEESIEDLVRVRMCDRIGSGVPKAVPYRLRHFQFRVEKVLREHEAVRVTMLNIRGDEIMQLLGIGPGPKVGHVLNALLEEVLDDPKKNEKEYLTARAKELGALSDIELAALREKAETRVELLDDQREQEIKGKYRVR